MANGQLNAKALSGRQLAAAALVAGLSPAAALAGRVSWYWLLLWSAAGVCVGWLLHIRMRGRAGGMSPLLRAVFSLWGLLVAARALSRGAGRLEITSGGSPRFWLLVLLAVPLLWMCWGRAAPFFRTVEILWLALAVVLGLVLLFGGLQVEWRYVFSSHGGWSKSVLAAAEIFAPTLFALPYIYKEEIREKDLGQALGWTAGLGSISVGLAVVTRGVLGDASGELTLPFFVAAGLLGSSARWEGLLSILWMLPDLVLAGLACRAWGNGRRPALAGTLAVGLAAVGIVDRIPDEFFGAGTLLLAILVFLFPGKKEK